MIKKLLGTLMLALTCSVAVAAGGNYPMDRAPDRLNDMASLQNGAKLFVNYCLNCHSANSMRYNKLTEIGLTDEQIRQNLLFTGERVGDLMKIALRPEDAKNWFGAAPPDLSVIARAKSVNLGPSGVDYVYTFLRTYYRDTSKGSGWDNLAFPNVGMPHVLWELQGPRSLEIRSTHDTLNDQGNQQWKRTISRYDSQGFYTTESADLQHYRGGEKQEHVFMPENVRQSVTYDNQVADIANFLGWMSEPNQLQRKQMGVWVLLFLSIFFIVAWRLNAVYWKNVR